ncbi:DUF4136 domain-containing protein [Spirosoma luteolum]
MNRLLLLGGLLLALVSCSPRVTVDQNNNVNFNKYRTFAWMDSDVKAGQNPLYYNQIATENVENTVARVLTDKGLQVASRRPDLLVGYHFFVENKTRTVATPNSPYYGPYLGWGRWGYQGWGPSWWGWGGQQYVKEDYQAGTLVVDMVDARTRRLVWRGSIQNAVSDPARIAAQLTREVEKIVEKFPDRKS